VRGTWRGWSLTGGQFKLPLSAEALQGAGSLVTIRRALFSESPTQIGLKRDLGLQLKGDLWPGVELTTGIFNGEGQNVVDRNDRKDLVARVVVSPWPWLSVGLNHQEGALGVDTTLHRRTGGHLQAGTPEVYVLAEVLSGQDGGTAELGWYGLGAWTFRPGWQAVARYESWAPDVGHGVEERALTLGLNWWLAPNTRLAINAIRETFSIGTVNHQAMLAWQIGL
jgi:hypothetical protein